MPGVYGHKGVPGEVWVAIPNGLAAGVLGTSHNWSGVIGWSDNWHGVEAYTIYGEAAIVADAQEGLGVWAYSSTLSGINGIAAAAGPPVPNNSNIAGVVGTSDAQHGVIGTSNSGVGIIGFSNNVAGQFIGDIQVTGSKSALVPFPDGTHRALYCMESPDLWFEDFGEAKLARGRAVVRLDTNFAKVIRTGDYRVFLTPEADCRGLYVRHKSAVSFEVRELTGGKSSIAFSYRIVGRRKDIRRQRFAKIDMRLPLPASPQRKPISAARARSFAARIEREARQRRQKVEKQSRRARKLPDYVRLARGIGRSTRVRATSRSKVGRVR
jgi:hypothetical protein